MKKKLFVSLIVLCISVAHADLTVKMGYTGYMGQNKTNYPSMGFITRIKGKKIREDVFFEGGNIGNRILNLDMDEAFKLLPDQKMVVKIPFDRSALTNAIPIDIIKDTGKTETVDGYEAEIYTFTRSDGATNSMWIAKDFPNFETIKTDLAKLDRFHLATESGGFHMSTLPGMLLKCTVDNLHKNILLQLVVIEGSVDESIFEVPKDYRFYSTNAPVANTNQVISATNEPPAK
jgi:hypothetical protein